MAVPDTYLVIFYVNCYFNHLLGILTECNNQNTAKGKTKTINFRNFFTYLKIAPDCISKAIETSALPHSTKCAVGLLM